MRGTVGLRAQWRHEEVVRLTLILFCLIIGGCEFETASNPSEQRLRLKGDLGSKDIRFSQCLQEHDRLSKCVELGPLKRMKGVWFTGFEESGFIPNADSVSLVRTADSVGAEFRTALELDASPVMKRLGLPTQDRCTRAVAIDFVGREAIERGPYYTGNNDHLVVVNRLIGARYLGRVRTVGLPGYDLQCATPAPTDAQIKAMDEANWEACEAAGQCIPMSKLSTTGRRKK